MDADVLTVVHAWNLLGGELRFDGLEATVELMDWPDPEWLVRGLIVVREFFAEKARAEIERAKKGK